MQYPQAERLDITDTLHGHAVADPYRWLEEAGSDATTAWSEAQDALAGPLLSSLAGRDSLRDRIRELLPGFISPPYILGERAFYTRRAPDQEHPVLVVRDPDGTERVLVDPAELSPDHTITLDNWSPSKEGDLLAYQLSEGGDEEARVFVMRVSDGVTVEGPIDRCRYSPIAWLPGGDAFYYVRRLPPDAVPEGEEQFHRRVYLHRLGTDPETEDVLVFGDGGPKTAYYSANTSRDGRWLFVSRSLGTAPRNDVWVCDLTGDGSFTTIQEGVDAISSCWVAFDGRMYVFTNRDAHRWKLCVTDPTNPQPEHWTDLLPESDAVLADVAVTNDAVVAVRTRHAVSEITVHDKHTGEALEPIELPGMGVAGVISKPEGGDEVWVGYTDHVTPYRVFHYDLANRALSPYADPPGAVEVKGVVAEQVFYRSADGTEIPMFVLRHQDTELDGRRPTVLNGYGGFNVPMSPAYASTIVTWVESGGVYAIACLRGGSEYGEEWHRAGMREHKQNVFDDFVAAGEYLVAQGYTSPQHLGISGGSNGGLLVGAALTQRPDLFRAVVCSAPLLDMIRYESFGLGETWNDEYGTVSDPGELEWLIGYSPYHKVTEPREYPAVLFTVFESDTRVDPMHARKMCAALQWAQTAPDRPILYRRETKVGHSQRSMSRSIDLSADVQAFMGAQLGLEVGA